MWGWGGVQAFYRCVDRCIGDDGIPRIRYSVGRKGGGRGRGRYGLRM